jgi:hypothetical protein
MQEEYNSLLENQTWDLVPLPSGRKLVRCRWVYRTKSTADGYVIRYKARLVSKGFQQVHGIDYDETFAPSSEDGFHTFGTCHCENQGMGSPSDGHEEFISSRRYL